MKIGGGGVEWERWRKTTNDRWWAADRNIGRKDGEGRRQKDEGRDSNQNGKRVITRGRRAEPAGWDENGGGGIKVKKRESLRASRSVRCRSGLPVAPMIDHRFVAV